MEREATGPMTTRSLPFADIEIVDRRIVIIQFNASIGEVSGEMVDALHHYCGERGDPPYVVISNKRASYSVSFSAIQRAMHYGGEIIELMAVVPDPSTRATLHWLSRMMPRYRFCDDLEQALERARELLAHHPPAPPGGEPPAPPPTDTAP